MLSTSLFSVSQGGLLRESLAYETKFIVALSRSLDDPYFGISTSTFPQKILSVLLSLISELDVEIKPDGMYCIPGQVGNTKLEYPECLP